MSYQIKDLLYHIVLELEFLNSYTNIEFQDLESNEVLKRAVTRSLEIIGEASKKLPNDFKDKYQEIEWRKLAGTRDVLIHDYFGIDYAIVYNILIEKIQLLYKNFQKILKESEKVNDEQERLI